MSNPTLTVSDFLGLPEPEQDEIRAWLAEHHIDRNDVYAIEVLSDHLVTVQRFKRPLEVVNDELVRLAPLTFQCHRPFPWNEATP